MKHIISQDTNVDSFLAFVTTKDLKQEIRKLEDQVSIAVDELRDFNNAHQRRPYLRDYVVLMNGGFVDSIRELRAQIRKVHAVLGQKEAAA